MFKQRKTMSKTFFIKKKKLNELNDLSKEIHSNISIIKMFCKSFEDVDEFYKVLPLINSTCKLSDKLYAQLINILN